jgi:uncharacterized OB-fold protein
VPPVPSRPDLVAVDDAGRPRLRVIHCRRCDARSFPPQQWGCEHCGAGGGDLDEELMAPRGTVLARATVHRDLFGRAVPYTIIELALDEGPAIRGLLWAPTADSCPIGSRVHGILTVDDARLDDGELVFATDGSP